MFRVMVKRTLLQCKGALFEVVHPKNLRHYLRVVLFGVTLFGILFCWCSLRSLTKVIINPLCSRCFFDGWLGMLGTRIRSRVSHVSNSNTEMLKQKHFLMCNALELLFHVSEFFLKIEYLYLTFTFTQNTSARKYTMFGFRDIQFSMTGKP